MINLSAQGFRAVGQFDLTPGERLEVLLPGIGRMDSHLVWKSDRHAGFQFERLIREDEFSGLLKRIRPC